MLRLSNGEYEAELVCVAYYAILHGAIPRRK